MENAEGKGHPLRTAGVRKGCPRGAPVGCEATSANAKEAAGHREPGAGAQGGGQARGRGWGWGWGAGSWGL